jgi:hypothetical protein
MPFCPPTFSHQILQIYSRCCKCVCTHYLDTFFDVLYSLNYRYKAVVDQINLTVLHCIRA